MVFHEGKANKSMDRNNSSLTTWFSHCGRKQDTQQRVTEEVIIYRCMGRVKEIHKGRGNSQRHLSGPMGQGKKQDYQNQPSATAMKRAYYGLK